MKNELDQKLKSRRKDVGELEAEALKRRRWIRPSSLQKEGDGWLRFNLSKAPMDLFVGASI